MTHFIKFLHLFFGVGLFSIVSLNYGLTWLGRNNVTAEENKFFKLSLVVDFFILAALMMMLISGILLVPLKSWTYQTAWIQAAFALLIVISASYAGFVIVKFKRRKLNAWACHVFFGTVIALFLILIRDAVTKTALL